MVLLDALDDGPARNGMRWRMRVAGAESNMAIALARLEVPVTWVSRLGTDDMGDVVAEVLSREGLDLRFVIRDPAAPTGAVVRIGAEGALIATDGGVQVVAPDHIEDVVDEVGAGDGFAAGFAYGLLHDWSPTACVHAGNVIAASALRGTGDWETYPRLEEVRRELHPVGDA